jgi:carbonic anhydrase/acetyltransferase-like protein (isoleucine patch superfamily)
VILSVVVSTVKILDVESAEVKRSVTAEELAWIKESAENYVKYAGQYLDNSSKTKPGFRI